MTLATDLRLWGEGKGGREGDGEGRGGRGGAPILLFYNSITDEKENQPLLGFEL
jgi:hypothetical protein